MKWILALATLTSGVLIVFAAWYLLRTYGASGMAHLVAVGGGFLIPPVSALVWIQRDWDDG